MLIGDTLVGHLRYTLEGRREHASFEYAADWLGTPTRYAIDPTLPLASGPQFAPRVTDLDASMTSTRYLVQQRTSDYRPTAPRLCLAMWSVRLPRGAKWQ